MSDVGQEKADEKLHPLREIVQPFVDAAKAPRSLWGNNLQYFMEGFYRELRAGRSAPEALRQTQLDFIASERSLRRQPHRWAPFVLASSRTPSLKFKPCSTLIASAPSRSCQQLKCWPRSCGVP